MGGLLMNANFQVPCRTAYDEVRGMERAQLLLVYLGHKVLSHNPCGQNTRYLVPRRQL